MHHLCPCVDTGQIHNTWENWSLIKMGKKVVKPQMDAGPKSPRDPTNMCRDSEDSEKISEHQQGTAEGEEVHDSGRTESKRERVGRTAGNSESCRCRKCRAS